MSWFIALIGIMIPAYLLRFSFFGLPTTVLELLIYLATLWLVIARPISQTLNQWRELFRQYRWPLILIIAGSLIGIIVSPDKRQALGLFKAYLFDPILLFLVIQSYWRDQAKDQLIKGLLISGALVGLSVLIGPKTADGRGLGLYTLDPTASPNFVGLYLGPLAILGLGLLGLKKPLANNWLVLLAVLMMIGAIGLSGSRGALLGLSTGLILIAGAWLSTRTRLAPKQVKLSVGLALVVLVGGGIWLARPDFRPEATGRAATSNNLRYEIWKTTLTEILPQTGLTGVGLGNYQPYFRQLTAKRTNYPEFIAPWALTPHNIFLTLWVNLGLLGLVGFLWLLVNFFRSLNAERRGFDLALVLQISMVSLLIHGLVDSAYWKNDLALLFWIFLALAHGLTTAKDQP